MHLVIRDLSKTYANGTEALKGLITALHDSGKFKSETVRVIADDDLAAPAIIIF